MGSDMNNTIMRTVSFVERIEVEYHGNIITQAMVLADVDNDMANELVVGNIEGHIAIFKGDSSKAWKKTTVSGMLTCLAVGEIHTPHKNSLVCITAEGWCYVYDITPQSPFQNLSGDDSDESRMFRPVFTQELPANARVMCLADIDSDGHVEMVIGYSDRVVRAFRWHVPHDPESGHFVPLQKWQLAGQIGSITINYDKEHRPELMVSQPGATFVSLQVRPQFRHIKSESHLDKLSGSRASSSLEHSGSFGASAAGDSLKASGKQQTQGAQSNGNKSDPLSSKTEPASSSGLSKVSAKSSESLSSANTLSSESKSRLDTSNQESVSKSKSESPKDGHNDSSSVKVSMRQRGDKVNIQPHISDCPFDSGESQLEKSQGRLSQFLDSSFDEDGYLIYHPLANSQIRNKDTSTVIIGGINRGRTSHSSTDSDPPQSQATYYALATLDGSLNLVENDTILWSLHVDHYLFTLSKLDVTGNGKEEVVCCSWSGQTYIVNHSKETVRYDFPDSVAAFCAGYYSVRDHVNVPCFVYATFNNRICIYPNISLPRVESTNLMKVMGRKKETKELLHKLNVNADDMESVQKLYHWCLYGQHRKS
ncbi:KICSTOR complex protein ITFG2 isoform X2 [Aplysia californica]|nr:KICSTOR complex protein ITFG2 isoform X2 [Aplysia californica]